MGSEMCIRDRYIYSGLFRASVVSLMVFNVVLVLASVVVALSNPQTLLEAFKGMISFGYVPKGVDMRLLASAIAWVGLGAMGNAFYSLLVRDRGWGRAKYIGRIPGILGKPTTVSELGYQPKLNSEDKAKKLKVWCRILEKEVLLVFLIPSLLSLFMFTYLAGAILHPLVVSGTISPESLKGIDAVLVQSKFFEVLVGPIGTYMYLLAAILVLWSTQIGLLDAIARTWADTLSVYSNKARNMGIRKLYMIVLILFVIIGLAVILSGAYQYRPVELLKLGALLGMIQQIISIPVTIIINHKLMTPEMSKASLVKLTFSGILACGIILYGITLLSAL